MPLRERCELTSASSDIPAITPESGRYVLLVTRGEIWSHVAYLVYKLKGLHPAIRVVESSNREFTSAEEWQFATPGNWEGNAIPTKVFALPALYDVKEEKLITSEPADIISLFDTAFNPVATIPLASLLPAKDSRQSATLSKLFSLITRLGSITERVTQAEFTTASVDIFAILDGLETLLTTSRYLEDTLTTNDLWLFALLVRFDVVFYPLFRLTYKRIADYPALSEYLRDIYSIKGVSDTVYFPAIRQHYFLTYGNDLQGKRIIPKGGAPNLRLPHTRDGLGVRFSTVVSANEEDQSQLALAGAFLRPASGFRDWIKNDGSSEFAAEPGRYHLYIANNCPWCHRVSLMRAVKGLQDVISMDVLYYRRDPERGWQFNPDISGCTPDTVNGLTFIRELYERYGSKEKSVPVLYDKKTKKIVSNESSEIIRMLNSEFNDYAKNKHEFYPSQLADRIDAINGFTYHQVNNGAYKAGFSSNQEAYDQAFDEFFSALDNLDQMLATSEWLAGDTITEADIRLFPTIYRFDPIYYTRMRLNLKMVRDYPNLSRWFKAMLAYPGVSDASVLEHCINGYFGRTGSNLVPRDIDRS